MKPFHALKMTWTFFNYKWHLSPTILRIKHQQMNAASPKQLLLENILQSYSNLKKSHMWAVIMNSSQSVSSCLRAFEEISGRFVISFCSCCGPSPVGRRTICNKNSFYAWEHMGIDVAFFSSFSPHAGLMAKCPILSACHDAFLYFKATKTVKAFGIGSAAEQWPPEPFF